MNSQISTKGPSREFLFKLLVIGEMGTGKTSIIRRYIQHIFSDHYKATIGVDFSLKSIKWDENTDVRFQLWDIAGQERFTNMTRVYYKEAVGCFIVYDITNKESFEACSRWKDDLDSKVWLPNGDKIPCILLGNKKDLSITSFATQNIHMPTFCKENGYSGWFETSAKENQNIQRAIEFMIKLILDKNSKIDLGLEATRNSVKLDSKKKNSNATNCC